jgi:hypothetical protein
MADYSIEVSIPNVGPQGPQGEVGPVGPANELTLGEITTGDPGTEAEATISGTPPNQVLDLVLPRGDTGAQGNPGPTGAGGVGVVPAPIYATMQEAVEDGITFGGVFRHTSGSVFWVEEPDPDAATFIAASGATDVWNIQKFVQGVKTLGLWDDMVCWPLRSAQNAGTGTTAYSLGGQGAFNGTLVGGPVWENDNSGITFANVANQYIATNYDISPVHSSVVAARRNESGTSSLWGQKANTGNNFPIWFGPSSGGAALGLFSFSVITGGGANQMSVVHNGSPAMASFAQFFAAWTATDGTVGFDGNNTTGNWPATLQVGGEQNDIILGASFGAASAQPARTMAAVTKFNTTLTLAQITAFRDLYKQTLGIGLSLP